MIIQVIYYLIEKFQINGKIYHLIL